LENSLKNYSLIQYWRIHSGGGEGQPALALGHEQIVYRLSWGPYATYKAYQIGFSFWGLICGVSRKLNSENSKLI